MSNDDQTTDSAPDEETTGDPALDRVLSEGVLRGDSGLDRAQVAMSAFLIVALGIAAYFNLFSTPFHHDEYTQIVGNADMQRVADSVRAWDAEAMPSLAAISLAVNRRLGDGPAPLRGVNLLLHLSCGILVYLLVRRLIPPDVPEAISMTAGMFFVVHPAASQAVNHLLNRSVLLGGFFGLLSVVLYLRATQGNEKSDLRVLSLSVFCFLLAAAADPRAWIVPLLILLADSVANRERERFRSIAAQLPYWALLGALMLLAATNGTGAPSTNFWPSTEAVTNSIATTVAPLKLLVSHAPYGPGAAGIPYLWAIALIVGIVLLRVLPVLGAAALWFTLALLAPGPLQSNTAFSEPNLYLPLAGVAILLPAALSAITHTQARQVAGMFVALLILGGIALTSMRNNEWKSEAGLWIEANEACPECYDPIERLAILHLQQGEATLQTFVQGEDAIDPVATREEAQQHFELALEFFDSALAHPDVPVETRLAHARALIYLGRRDEAESALKQMLREFPRNTETVLAVATLEFDRAERTRDLDDVRRALDFFEAARALEPLLPEASVRYARLLLNIGDVAAAAAVISKYDGTDPTGLAADTLNQISAKVQATQMLQQTTQQEIRQGASPERLLALQARLLHFEGRYLQSSYVAQEAARRNALDKDTWLVLGLNAAHMGSLDQFFLDWPLGPPDTQGADIWKELANVCASAGRWNDALAVFQQASLDPESPLPLMNLARVAAERQDGQRALAYYQQAAQTWPEDPRPWLAMADVALLNSQPDAARQFIAQAQQRGATAEQLDELKERAGVVDAPETPGLQRTIIR